VQTADVNVANKSKWRAGEGPAGGGERIGHIALDASANAKGPACGSLDGEIRGRLGDSLGVLAHNAKKEEG
jgi:hypothetical protein